MSSYTPKYPMPSGFKIQGHTPTQEEYDQMMDLLAYHAVSSAPIQTSITSTPPTQVVAIQTSKSTAPIQTSITEKEGS